MPFTYQPFDSRLTASIGELMAHRGDPAAQAAIATAQAHARAAEASGRARASIGETIGNGIQGITQQIEQNRLLAPRRELEALQVQSARQSAQDDLLFRHALSLSKDGDLGPAVKFLQSQGGVGIGAMQKLQGLVKSQQDQHDEAAGELGYQILKGGGTPDAVGSVVADAVKSGALTAEQGKQFHLMSVENPDKVSDAARALMARSDKFRPLLDKVDWAEPGKVGFDAITHQPIPGMAAPIVPKTRAELAADAANLNSPTHDQSAKALTLDKPPVAPPRGSLDEQLLEAITKGDKQTADTITITMRTAAQAKGDPSMQAATERQIAAINAQAAQQKRSQDFEVLKTARAEVEKANTAYTTARTSADTLRDVVTSAKAGNKVAGSLQALETTMAAIRAQGLNRINTAEIGVTGNAGSMYDRISGWLGKKIEGQPVPPDIQKDMLEFADILQKAAYKKYSDTHNGVNKLYGTSIPTTFSEPVTGTAPQELTPGLKGVSDR